MPRAKDTATQLAEKMVLVLAAQRRLGGEAYPLVLRRLAELTEPAASAALALESASKPPFKKVAIAVAPKTLEAPVALAEDAEQLAGSALALNYLLHRLCDAGNPTCAISKLKAKVPRPLRSFFESSLSRSLETNTLPSGVGALTIKKRKHLHLKEYPLPKMPAEVLAERLIQEIRARRERGGAAYPVRLAKFFQETVAEAEAKYLKTAMKLPAFREQAIVVATIGPKIRPDGLVALAADSDVLQLSEGFLEALLDLIADPANQLMTPAELKNTVAADWRTAFETSLERRIETRTLPHTIGCLRHKKKPLLFLIRELFAGTECLESRATESRQARPDDGPSMVTQPTSAPVMAATPPFDFAVAFDAAFQRLDRKKGSHNFVSLVDLRRETAMERPIFDVELRKLRLAGRYTLSAAEGRHGICPEERAAGIEEDGALLLYVSRKLS
jgi:hypothetical protein